MATKTIKGETFYRSFPISTKSVDMEKRIVELSFASEYPAERYFGTEILDCSPDSVDLARMNSGGALLLNHDPSQQVGVCERATVGTDKMVRGTFRFSKSALGQEILTDVSDGIRTLVSVGYRLNKLVTEKVENGAETLRAVRWTPFEASLVAVPLDPTVGVGRSQSKETYDIEVIPLETKSMKNLNLIADPAPGGGGATVDVQVIEREAGKKERLRIAEIDAVVERCVKHNPAMKAPLEKAAKEAKESGQDIQDFRRSSFESTFDAKPTPVINPEIGMSNRDLKDYSILRAIRSSADHIKDGKMFDGLEREASDAVAKRIGKEASGFFIPEDVLRERRALTPEQIRTLNVGSFTAAGALVDTDLLTGSFIELLRNRMVVNTMGAISLSGLVGNVAIPSQTGGATAYWLTESGTVTLTNQAVGQLSLTPHRLSAATAYSKQLLVQSSLDVENFVRNDLLTILAIEKDRAALNGAGAGGEPLGIINTTGLSTTVTLTNASTCLYANALTAEGNLATSNADAGKIGFVTTVATRTATKAQSRFANTDTPVWTPDNTINGYPAKVTNQMPSTTSFIYGNWGDLILADWSGIDVVVDPYSLVKASQIQVVINLWTDNGIRHAKSFLISNQ